MWMVALVDDEGVFFDTPAFGDTSEEAKTVFEFDFGKRPIPVGYKKVLFKCVEVGEL